MKLQLFKKYFFTTSIIILTSLTVMMIILSFVLNNYIAQTKQETLTKACAEVGEFITLVSSGEEVYKKPFINIIRTVADVSDADIFIADENGRVMVCACKEWNENGRCMHSASRISENELERNLNVTQELYLSTLGVYEKPHYVSSKPLYTANKEHYATVFATTSVTAIKKLLSTITKLCVFSAVFPIIIMFFAIYAMTYKLTKPLKLMSEASRAMAKGDFSKRIPVMSDDEIGELSVSFNMMTNSLAQLEGMRKSFVANVSHELKTPMTTIGGFIDGILDGTIEPEKQSYYLGIVSDEVKRLSRLVQSMLSMARLESGEFALKPELFDLRELLCTIVVSQEQRIEKQELNVVGLDEISAVSINADKDLIHQVIYNLVDNAIKFSNVGGSLNFGLKAENKRILFTITNTGKGIPQKDLPFVFERFYKVDKSRSTVKNSTGLGLYIVKTIVTAHGGTISVASRQDEFTTFRVVLPMD